MAQEEETNGATSKSFEGMSPLEALQAGTNTESNSEGGSETDAPEGQPAGAGLGGSRAGAEAALDIGQGIVGGIRDGVQETAETMEWAGNSLLTDGADAVNNLGISAYNAITGSETPWVTTEEVKEQDKIFGADGKIHLPKVPENDTMGGSVARGAAQFLTGYGVFGRAVKTLKGATAAGAATDFVAFDEHEERFSDFLRETTGLRDPVTEFLSADSDDSVLEGKLKNSLEGMGLGLAAEGITRLARAFKTGKQIKADEGPEAAAKHMQEEVERLAEENPRAMQLELFDETTDPNAPKRTAARGAEDAADDAAEEASTDASLNEVFRIAKERRARKQARPDFDTQSFQESINREMGLVRGGSMPDPNRTLDSDFFNFEKMDSDLSTKDYLNMATDAVPDDAITPDGSFKGWMEQSERFLADSVDGTTDDVRAYLRRSAEDSKRQQKALLAGKKLMQSMSREIEDLAYRIDAGASDDMTADMNKMVRLQSHVMELVADVKSVQKGAAQTTAAGRIHTTDTVTGQEISRLDIQKQLEDSLNHQGGEKEIKRLARDIINQKQAQGGAASVLRTTKNRAETGKFWKVVNEVRINGLLSGPRTQAINMLSNAVQMTVLPGEKIVGSALRADPKMMKEGFQQYMGLALALKDSLSYANLAFKKGRNILDPEAAILEANGVDYRAISSQSDNKVARNLINNIGAGVRLPSRGLVYGDELFKQMNYRSHMYGKLSSQVSELVKSGEIDKADAAKWIDDKMKASMDRHGGAKDMDSINYAREATFTDELLPGAMRDLQNFTNRHPGAKVVVPFIRTPTNLIVGAGQRTPIIQAYSKRLRDGLRSSDPSERSRAVGKIAVGGMLWGSLAMAAMEGKITGGGPVDPRARARLKETGWKPYSYKIEGKDGSVEYVEYNRLDPYATMAGIAADVVDISGQLDEKDREEIGLAAMAAVANNITSKLWMKGATDFAAAMSEPEMRMQSYRNQMLTSFMPYSSALRSVRQAKDPAMREVETIVEAFKNNIPGYSEDLPARRSMITGEPILYPKGWGDDAVTPLGEALASVNPLMASDWEGDPVLDELANLGEGVVSKPSKKIRGVELTPEQYETYIELHGKIRNPSTKRTLYQELEHTFKRSTYDFNRERYEDASDPEFSRRISMVRRVILGYRDLARQELMQRYPDLRQSIEGRKDEIRTQMRRGATGINNITELGE